MHSGVRSDHEVGDDVLPGLDGGPALVAPHLLCGAALGTGESRGTTAQVFAPGSARPVERFGTRGLEADACIGEEAVQVGSVGEVGGQLGVDRLADDDGARPYGLGQGALRLVAVGRARNQYVEEDAS